MKTNKIARLLGTASIAAFAYAGALSAESVSIEDYADFGNTYENWVDINFDLVDNEIDINSFNFSGAEGALGAINTGIDQVAVTQFVNVGVQTDSEHDTLIDLSHDASEYMYNYVEYMDLTAGNEAIAHTTALDAILGGSQVAVTSFNTASLDIVGVGEDSAANVALLQELDANWDYAGEDGYDLYMSSTNVMEAATAYAGTATIDSNTWNAADEAWENGVQQAAVSANTFSLSSDVDTTIELAGQDWDTDDLDGWYWDGDIRMEAMNSAVAFSPVPATDDLVDPRLASELNDPSISNLDQIAAITLNTISLGNAANADEEIEASTADFTVYSYANSGGYEDLAANGQEAGFTNDTYELELGNALLATTMPELYDDFSYMDGGILDTHYYYDGGEDIGNVSIDNASQVVALTINSMTSAGEGDLTLKEIYAYGEDYIAIDHDDFDQSVSGLDYSTGMENAAAAATMVGDANVSNLDQIAQYSLNSIRSGGDLNGWNEEENGIDQYVDYDFYADGGYIFSGGVNSVTALTYDGSANASDLTQVVQFSANTVSVAGDMTSALDQYNEENNFDLDSPVNAILAWGAYDNTDGVETVSIDTAEQVALFSFNTVSVGGALDTDYMDQHFDADSVDIHGDYMDAAYVNTASAWTPFGNASASGLDQIAQLTFNSISAGSFGGEDSYVHQEFVDLGYYDGYIGHTNDINVRSEVEGNASIADASQALILNANSMRFDGAVTGGLEQDLVDIYIYGDGNEAYAWANQDAGDARWAGGNASIEGLTQTLSISMNSISAGSLDGTYINQYAQEVDINVGNYAYADAEWGAATMTGVSQATINRINSISITPVSLN